jgi:RNA polymerase sigma factor (sigma-70 family)
VILIEKVTEKDFQLNSKLTTFLIGISINQLRNLMRKENRSDQFIQFSSELPDTIFIKVSEMDDEKEDKLRILDSILDTIQERCKQILRLFYFEKKSMQEISEIMKFSSMQSAKTQKYKCLEKAHQMANELIVESKNAVL